VTHEITTLISEGATLVKIANQLTQQAVPLPSGVYGVWTATQVRRVLGHAGSAN
jgi:hypothetical protein